MSVPRPTSPGWARAIRDEATAAAAVERARGALAFFERVRAVQTDDAFGGRLASMTAIAEAESRRADGAADPDAWRTAVAAAEQARGAWPLAYARYRLAESLLEARAPRRDAEAALADAHASADRLGAAPLREWVDGLARRARVQIPEPEGATLEVSDQAPDAAGTSDDNASGPPAAAAALDGFGLTRREREVLPLVAAGHTNKRIAEILFISENTAGVHVSNILGKLGVQSRAEAAAVAARLGLDRPKT